MKGKPGRKTAQPKTRALETSEGSEVLPGQSLCPVVGIGASAGGIEALIRLFEALPPDTGMAFLVVMHLDPTRESGLTDVLSQHTSLAVIEAAEGMAIEADHIYVIPPGSSLTIEAARLRLTEPAERRGAR